MKDLFVLTADSDMQAVMRAVLSRHRNLRIHPISFEVERYTGRDSGMIKDGPEFSRMRVSKTEFSRLILIWDHHGSGRHTRLPTQVAAEIQQRLDGVTWADRSAAIVAVPELEEWLWHCPVSLARHLGVDTVEFDNLAIRAAAKLGRTRERCCRDFPKEVFEDVLYAVQRRKPLPEDFRLLGTSANLSAWAGSESFHRFVEILRGWFPIQRPQ